MISKVIDIRVWKANKLRPWIDQLDRDRKILKKNTNHLVLIKGGKDDRDK